MPTANVAARPQTTRSAQAARTQHARQKREKEAPVAPLPAPQRLPALSITQRLAIAKLRAAAHILNEDAGIKEMYPDSADAECLASAQLLLSILETWSGGVGDLDKADLTIVRAIRYHIED